MPRQVDHVARRAEIIAAAWTCMGETGIEGLTLRAVAASAQCGLGRITHYFNDKEELIVATLSAFVDETFATLDAQEPKTIDELVEGLAEFHLPTSETTFRLGLVWLHFWARAAYDEGLAEINRLWYAGLRGGLARMIGGLQELGQVPATVDASDAADQIAIVLDGIGIQAALDRRLWAPSRQTAVLGTYIAQILHVESEQRQPRLRMVRDE
ncbi:TetR family transcriptional regulator C-terminal domain-containing protein [Streptomyces sp. NPDC002928]|uniref:TetR/AcrR family transcriptional regulator n=1 Tax=Streptomyces sp. NPDC002928 TaxID=3154440 RepID=UPI0033B66B77